MSLCAEIGDSEVAVEVPWRHKSESRRLRPHSRNTAVIIGPALYGLSVDFRKGTRASECENSAAVELKDDSWRHKSESRFAALRLDQSVTS